MAKLFLQGKVLEVPMSQFLDFFQKWVRGCKDFVISCIYSHMAGLADFSGRYTSEMIQSIKTQSKVIEEQIENKKIKSLLREFMDVIDKVWFFEEEIIKEYSKEVKLDISIEDNRKKLQRKVKNYRFGDISHGTSAVAPKKVMELSKSSAKLVKEIEHITNSLDIEIEFTLKKLA